MGLGLPLFMGMVKALCDACQWYQCIQWYTYVGVVPASLALCRVLLCTATAPV